MKWLPYERVDSSIVLLGLLVSPAGIPVKFIQKMNGVTVHWSKAQLFRKPLIDLITLVEGKNFYFSLAKS